MFRGIYIPLVEKVSKKSPSYPLFESGRVIKKLLVFETNILPRMCHPPPTHTHHFLSSPVVSNLVSCYYYSLHFFEGLHLPAKRFLSVLQQPCCLCRIPSRNHFCRDTVLVVIQTNSSVHRIGTRMATRGDLFKSIKNTTIYGLQTIQYFGSKLWNTLTLFIHVDRSTVVFHSKFKSYLLDSYSQNFNLTHMIYPIEVHLVLGYYALSLFLK